MANARADFASVPWEKPAPGIRVKTFTREGFILRLLELTPEFEEEEWCLKGHTGYVLEGDMELTFEDRSEKLTAGDGLMILGDGREKHKARVLSQSVTLILVEELEVISELE